MNTLLAGALAALVSTAALAHPGAGPSSPIESQQHEASALAGAARAFLDTLDVDQRDAALFAMDDDEARDGWSNLPTVMAPRRALSVADLSPPQRIALHRVLARFLSSEGYGEAVNVMWLEDRLREATEPMVERARTAGELTEEQLAFLPALLASYDSENFFVRVFGDPGDPVWGFVLDGHHLAINAAIVDGRIAYSPVFLGASPQTIAQGRFAGRLAFQHELDAVGDLIDSLTRHQREVLSVSGDVEEAVFAGTGWAPDMDAAPVGVNAGAFTDAQARLLWRAIDEFSGFAAPRTSAARMASLRKSGLEGVHVAWWGDPSDTAARFMLRITGPALHIDMTREGSRGEIPNNHVHIIVRDPSNEYGARWLEDHYAQAHGESGGD